MSEEAGATAVGAEGRRESSPRSGRYALLGFLLLGFTFLSAAYASFHPAQGRFYDERFALQNVHSVLQRGRLEPANGYYATLSYLPQTLALASAAVVGEAWWGSSWIYQPPGPPPPEASPVVAGAAFTPLAYRICRGIQILWGVGALALLFVL
ncbi:MAG: hypothetical protein MI919_15920, partial [Holophagales bacterium]|nr:hypothetical protein [Holophagales bacterium]